MLDVIMSEPDPQLQRTQVGRQRPVRSWFLLLIAPYLGLCFPLLYTRLTPVLWGFPFFYWYQFAWVLLTSALLALVYFKTKGEGSLRKRP